MSRADGPGTGYEEPLDEGPPWKSDGAASGSSDVDVVEPFEARVRPLAIVLEMSARDDLVCSFGRVIFGKDRLSCACERYQRR